MTTQTSDISNLYYNSNQMKIKPKSYLFVQGFDTKYQNNYNGLINYLNNYFSDQTISDIITYDNNTDINLIIEQIISKLASKKYDLIIGHSMGGFLLAKTNSIFLCKNKNQLDLTNLVKSVKLTIYDLTNIELNLTETKIILLQPLLEPNFMANIVSKDGFGKVKK